MDTQRQKERLTKNGEPFSSDYTFEVLHEDKLNF
jgi:hypothetical protein